MPFGLANAPAIFSRLIQMTLGKVDQNIALYLDDVMLPTTSVQEGLILLEKVLELLTQAKLKLNLSKCSFLKRTATYLGHEISAGTIQPGQAKIKCVADYNRPRNVHEIRQFIGLTSYFRKFVPSFAQIARPLTELTKMNVKWHWGPDQEAAFITLKQRLIEKPVLAIYNSDAKSELHTDASKIGLGGIFMQYQRDGSLKPIAYFSRVTSNEEKHYHSYELETLAVVESLKRFRIYLTGVKVKVITDCSALRSTLVKRDLIPRIARWWLTIQEFDLEIEYRPGERMKHVDALSRNPVANTILMIDDSDWLITVQLQDDNIQNIISRLHANSDSNLSGNYIVKDNILFKKTVSGERFVIPKLAKYGLLQKLHDQIGHPGFEKCESAIKAQFWFE
ncbi:jg230, partial [Pararge aegeria aegeria]